MSNLQNSFDGIRRAAGKAPERSNFVQTCNLLSQFLKGKSTIRDLSIGIASKSEVEGKTDVSRNPETSTMDLLTIMEKPSIESKEQEQKSIDPVPQNATTESSREMEVVVNEASTSKEAPKETKAAQLTMFYDGKVIVFDDFPADKARAVMLLASKGCPQSSFGTFQTTTIDKINTSGSITATAPSVTCNRTDSLKPSTIPIAPLQQQQQLHASLISGKTDKFKPGSISAAQQQQHLQTDQLMPGSASYVPQKQQQIQSQAAGTTGSQQIQSQAAGTSGSDLPIARRSSLHRFLEKRKDRAGARAPYQVHHNPLPSSSNNGESSSKDCEEQLDLNFKL